MSKATKKRHVSKEEYAQQKIGMAIEQISKSVLTLHDEKAISDDEFCTIVDCLAVLYKYANYAVRPKYTQARLARVWK